MPTSSDESTRIVAITREYLTAAEMRELFSRLNQEVGVCSSNDSVKQSFAAFHHLTTRAYMVEIGEQERTRLIIKWFLIWAGHMALILINLGAALIAPFFAPWYLAGPVVFTVVWVVGSPAECPITRLENGVRERLGWTKVRGFIGHYLIRPVRRFLRRRRAGYLDAASSAR